MSGWRHGEPRSTAGQRNAAAELAHAISPHVDGDIRCMPGDTGVLVALTVAQARQLARTLHSPQEEQP